MSSIAENLPSAARPRKDETEHLHAAWRAAQSHCIKCGFCLPACPTYRETGQEASSPRGRLDLMYGAARGQLSLAQIERELSFCLGCLACETACPSGIRFHDMLEAGRIDAAATPRGHALRRFLLDRVLVSQAWLRGVVWALYLFQRSGLQRLVRASRAAYLLGPRLGRLERRTPPVARPVAWRPQVRTALAGAEAAPAGAKAVALLTGCVMDAAFGEVHAATVKVLAANGYIVNLAPGQACCGALHLHAGEKAEAQALARRNIAAFEALGDAPVITNSAGCGALMKEYGLLLADDPAWAQRAERFSARVRDVCEFLAGLELAPPPRSLPLKVAYDDPCHLLHAQRIGEQPRQVLARVPGLELVPLAEADACCGSAGSYSLTQPEMSARLLARKMHHIAASGAQVVATGNPGCLLQLRLGVREHGVGVRVVHPVELLAEAYGGE